MSDESLTPASLLARVAKLAEEGSLPPVHRWNPPLCENLDMRIDRSGRWYFMNSPIGRERMVKLFSTVLRYDDDGHYYLVTPVEKIRLLVEDRPFVIHGWEVAGQGEEQVVSLRTNLGDEFVLDETHPLRVEVDRASGEPSPYVRVRDNLEALVSRNVFYQLVAVAEPAPGGEALGIWSCGRFWELGRVRD